MQALRNSIFAGCFFVFSQLAYAGEITGFESKNICKNGVLDREKLIIHRGKLNSYKINSLSTIRRDWESLVIKDVELTDFIDNHDQSLFDIRRKSTCLRTGSIDNQEFIADEICIVARCIASAGSSRSIDGGKPKETDAITTRFSLRGKPEDLRKNVKLPTASSATFFGKQDIGRGNWSANAKLAAGAVVEGYLTEIRTEDSVERYNPFSFVPYVTYERRFSTAPKSAQVNKLGAGLYLDAYFRTGDIGHILGIKTEFITDDEGGSSIVDGELLYYPSLPIPYFEFLQPIGPDQRLAMMFEPSGRFEYGQVFDAGNNIKLLDTKDYVRAGGELTFILTGNPADTNEFFDQFKVTASYKWLYGFDGPIDKFERFETGIDYLFGDQKNFSVGLKYVNGHTDTTLQEDEFVEGTFSVKF